MKYYKYLYLADGLEKKRDKIIKKLEQRKLQLDVHLVTLPRRVDNQLEVFNAMLLMQKNYPKEDYFVVGIAKSYEDALEIVEKITQEVYDRTKGADIRAYLLKKEQEG